VLRNLRDRLPLELAAHLGAQLPLLIPYAYYDQFRPGHMPERFHSEDEFLTRVIGDLCGIRPVNAREAARSAFAVLDRHGTPEQLEKVKWSLPAPIRVLWPVPGDIDGAVGFVDAARPGPGQLIQHRAVPQELYCDRI